MKLQKKLLLSLSIMLGAAALPGMSGADNASQCKAKEAQINTQAEYFVGTADHGKLSQTYKENLAKLRRDFKGFKTSCSKVKGYTFPKYNEQALHPYEVKYFLPHKYNG